MTRVLQIRRGTAAQNNDFTGLPGEITMDTDNKTLRIHDGETLGGFALQRADNTASDTGTLNLDAVPDEFWANIVARHTPAPFSVFETVLAPMNSNCSYLNYVIGDIPRPYFIQTALVCQSPDAGYSVGDEVWAFGIGSRTNPIPNYMIDHDGLHICLMVGFEKYWASHRDTGATTELTDTNWCILFRVYY